MSVIEHLMVPLKDGTRLAARLWLPDGEAHPVPAILEYIPYRKRDGTRGRDEPMHGFFAAHGYAAIRVDMRGSGESEGLLEDEYLVEEQDDALEVIAWIAQQAWCNGHVGMMGKSWGGFNALQVAARRPPALKAIITVCSTDDRFSDDIHYMGGCLLNDNLWWGSIMLAYQGRPPDPALVGEDWRRQWLERLEHMPFWPALWLKHQRRDAYWRHGSVCEDWSAIQCPVFAIGGWADAYTNAVPRLLEHLTVPRLGVIGPWAHIYPQDAAPGPSIGFLQEALRWWDHWLKGADTGIMAEPQLRAFVEDWQAPSTSKPDANGRWVGEPRWPSPAISPRTWHLAPGRLAATPAAPANLSIRSPLWTGMAAGEWMGTGVAGEMPADQRLDDGLSVVFDTAPLAEAVEVLGNPELTLTLSSDLPQGQLAARLCDVAPDGSSLRVSYAVLNLTHRHGSGEPQPMDPGRPETIAVRLKVCGHRFAPGHRIRLSLSSAYWPLVWPARDRATLSLETGASRLVLPCRAANPDEIAPAFAPPARGPATPQTMLMPSHLERTASLDLLSGVATYVTVGEGGLFGEGLLRFDEIDTSVNHSLRRSLTIQADDPLSATSVIDQTYEMGRDGWRIEIETTTSLTAQADGFIIEGTLIARENGDVVHRRNWQRRLARDHL
ncbi:CocE/NonD family hydrolase [Oleomonas cavernae]|uniref:CocE/NonD family hydrolase n=1 Tax=Oleomonas cavernae TaxID=2320859 RepID=A0A418WU78_9PROT|nr:CocE/NonD family hydrolase [Oleomonas cavernae]RJF94757.1 CocE/NonD family hydrolase [Oleomonas cavernae]